MGKEALKPSNWVQGYATAGKIAIPIVLTEIITGGIGGLTVLKAETQSVKLGSVEASLTQRATDIHSALSPATQSRNTTAVASATTSEGNSVTLVASNENRLRGPQVQALKPGEIAVEGKGHAEVTILNHAQANGMTVNAVAASRPICPSCATAISNAGAVPASPLKIVTPKPTVDATYVRPPITIQPRQ